VAEVGGSADAGRLGFNLRCQLGGWQPKINLAGGASVLRQLGFKPCSAGISKVVNSLFCWSGSLIKPEVHHCGGYHQYMNHEPHYHYIIQ